MSNHSKSKKKTKNSIPAKKHFNKLKMIVFISLAILIIGIAVFVVILNTNSDTSKIKKDLCKTYWTPISARNASDDEVEIEQIYNTEYSSYKGSLEYHEDNTFSFWMSPGSPDDGTHSGKYEVADNSTVNMYFDDGTNTKFGIEYADGKVLFVEANYDNYKIKFGSVD